jgi:hypothetical protein
MTREKSYTPVASYDQLKLAETAVAQATTADHIREATRQHGAKIGYKAFCYLLTGKTADWYRNLMAAPRVELWLPNGRWLAALGIDNSLWLWPITLPKSEQ